MCHRVSVQLQLSHMARNFSNNYEVLAIPLEYKSYHEFT